ncbi:MAG: UPF0182 family protein [Thermomicrobiales bacterium]
MVIALLVVVAIFVLITVTSSFWVNWWWFSSMDRRSLLTDRYIFQGASFLIGALLTTLIFGGNLIVALRRTRQQGQVRSVARVSNRILFWLVILATVILAFLVGSSASSAWETWAKWRYGSSFGYSDPYMHRDIGFYIFALPALEWIYRALLTITLLALAGTLIVYLLRTSLRFSIERVPAGADRRALPRHVSAWPDRPSLWLRAHPGVLRIGPCDERDRRRSWLRRNERDSLGKSHRRYLCVRRRNRAVRGGATIATATPGRRVGGHGRGAFARYRDPAAYRAKRFRGSERRTAPALASLTISI